MLTANIGTQTEYFVGKGIHLDADVWVATGLHCVMPTRRVDQL